MGYFLLYLWGIARSARTRTLRSTRTRLARRYAAAILAALVAIPFLGRLVPETGILITYRRVTAVALHCAAVRIEHKVRHAGYDALRRIKAVVRQAYNRCLQIVRQVVKV
jgi:hypothetical protein